MSGSKAAKTLEGKRLDEIVKEFIRGISVPPKQVSDKRVEGSSPYVHVSDLNDGIITGFKLKYVHPGFLRTNEAILRNGDVLLSITGTVGKVALVTREFEEAIAGPNLIVLRVDETVANPDYLCSALATEVVQDQFASLATGSAIRYARVSDLKNVIVPIPPVDEQERRLKIINTLREDLRKKRVELHEISRQIGKIVAGEK